MDGLISDIQHFSIHDGPGIRTTVFLKGCPLHCRWCHNPETQAAYPEVQYTAPRCIGCGACAAVCPTGCHRFDATAGHRFDSTACRHCFACAAVCLPRALEVCGRRMTVEDVLQEVEKDRAFYGAAGGITLSGGEPMAQPDFALALLRAAQAAGLHTCIETSGFFAPRYLEDLCDACDLLFWDIKDTDRQRHLAYTGADPAPMWETLRLAAARKPEAIVLRGIVVRGVNDDPAHVRRLRDLAASCGIRRVELFPFHPYGGSKRAAMGYPDPPMDKAYIPDGDVLQTLRALLNE